MLSYIDMIDSRTNTPMTLEGIKSNMLTQLRDYNTGCINSNETPFEFDASPYDGNDIKITYSDDLGGAYLPNIIHKRTVGGNRNGKNKTSDVNTRYETHIDHVNFIDSDDMILETTNRVDPATYNHVDDIPITTNLAFDDMKNIIYQLRDDNKTLMIEKEQIKSYLADAVNNNKLKDEKICNNKREISDLKDTIRSLNLTIKTMNREIESRDMMSSINQPRKLRRHQI
jgi:regulator of replication initiation timing